MEGVIRRSRYARYGPAVRRKRKSNVKQELAAKIIKQLIICILILFVITMVKLLNFPATNSFLAGCGAVLERETNLQSLYGTIDNVVNFFKKNDIKDMFSEDAVPASIAGQGVAGFEAGAGLVPEASYPASSPVDSIVTGNSSAAEPGNASGGAPAAGSTQAAGDASSSQAVLASQGTTKSAVTSASQAAVNAIKQKYSFQFPVDGIITSGYGKRIHPIKKTEEFHNGIDIEAPKGTPVKAALDGEVLEVSEDPSFGKFIRLKTDNDIVTVYAHCSQILASKGQKIKKGGTIARVGDTGYSLGTHLHFEVWVNGKSTDPALYFER